MTINEALGHLKRLTQRRHDLISLRNENSHSTTRYLGAHADKSIEKQPIYDVIALDTRITLIDQEMQNLDRALKATNAVTAVAGYEPDLSVLAPIQK